MTTEECIMIGPFILAAGVLIWSLTSKPEDETPPPPPSQISEQELSEAIARLLVEMKPKPPCR